MLNRSEDLDLQVAQLLVSTGFMSLYDLDKAHAWKRNSGQLITEYIAENRLVTGKLLDSAKQVMKAINENKLAQGDAQRAFYMIGNCGMHIDEALHKIGRNSITNPWAQQLLGLAGAEELKS